MPSVWTRWMFRTLLFNFFKVKMDRRAKTHPTQWSAFLDFAESHPVILTKKFDSISGRKKYNELWMEVSAILNSMGFLQKPMEKWQKAVADWRSKVKAKAAELNRGLTQTGGGGAIAPLNENEARLLAIIGWTSVTGTNVSELGFETQTVEPSPSTVASIWNKAGPCNVVSVSTEATITTQSPVEIPSTVPNPEPESDGPGSTNVCLSPPPLYQIKKKIEVEGNKKKRKLVQNPKSSLRGSSSPSRLDEFHRETLSALNDINGNLKRMADAQERICCILENIRL